MGKSDKGESSDGDGTKKPKPGSLRSLFNQSGDTTASTRKVLSMLLDDHPYVVDMLGGMPADGDLPAVPGSALTLYVRDGQLKWSINVKAIHQTFFGVVEDPLNLWGCINCALAMGDCSQKDYTEQKPSGGNEKDIPH